MLALEHGPRPAAVAFVLLLAAGCVTGAPYRWVDELPAESGGSDEYRIAARDVLAVRVWNQDAMSLPRARVREDGRVSLPFVKDVVAAGLTTGELGRRLQQELLNVIVDPVVTVTLEEPALLNVSVVGEVVRPGAFPLPRPAGVLHALAAAGGLTQYAERDGIYVLRRTAGPGQPPTRVRFRYRDLTGGSTRAAGFLLQSGDVVVVE